MNEKFFDLKKEKQDRIMGAAMEMFALSGYAHASTDDMVKRAHISKGLLFHYFGSKLALYGFLYDYCVRFMSLEIGRSIPQTMRGFYAVQEVMLEIWEDAMRQYPYIRLFLRSAERETDAEVAEVIAKKREDFRALTGAVRLRYEKARFEGDIPLRRMEELVRYSQDGLLMNADKTEAGWQEAFLADARAHLEWFRRLAAELETETETPVTAGQEGTDE